MLRHQLVIIGAGVTGLTAASELIQNGHDDILVLEAQNRIGGRVHTVKTGNPNQHIELGAQWIHGQKNNPIFELCSELNMVDKQTKTDFSPLSFVYTQNGERVDNKDEYDSIFANIEKIFKNAEDYDEDNDVSVGAYTHKKFMEFMRKQESKSNWSKKKASIAQAIYDERCKEELAGNGTFSLNEASLLGSNEYEDFSGDFLTNLKNGYIELIDHFASKIPSHKLRLNEVVKKIQKTDDNHFNVISYNSETETETVIRCDQVLCTISLGCLKAIHGDLFEPSLPKNKVNAIERLGFGTVNKLFVFFDEPVFKKHAQGFTILWQPDASFHLDSVQKYNLQNTSFYKSFTAFEVLPKMSNVLYSFITGEDAKFIETLDEDCLLAIISEIILKCVPDLHLPEPQKIMRSQWSQNPFTRGSYSYFKMGSTVKDTSALSEPLFSRLHFAGEATHANYYGTVHGAYASGLRASKNILKIYGHH